MRREPRLRIRGVDGRLFYDVRLDHMLRIEALQRGTPPPPEALTVELVEGPAGSRVIARETYTAADFPLHDDDQASGPEEGGP